jgi:hypothetical protein
MEICATNIAMDIKEQPEMARLKRRMRKGLQDKWLDKNL